jgi:glutathione S-transferase
MITVHHLNNSRSHRILWLLEELDVPYEIVRYQRDPATMLAPEALRRVHPLGKSPVISDGDLVIAESGAIIDYLVSRYGAGRLVPPEGSPERLRYTFWLHYAEGSAMPPLLLKLVFRTMAKRAPWLIRPIAAAIAAATEKAFIDPQLALHGGYWEAELAKTPWFAGDEFTAADIQMSFPVELFLTRSGITSNIAHLTEFAATIQARPAYQRAIARGGELHLA